MLPKRFSYPSPGFSEYWQSVVGKKMLAKLGFIPTPEKIEMYGKLLLETDSVGNEVVMSVFETMGYQKAHQLLNEILKEGIDKVENVPAPMKQLFAEADVLPPWLDEELMEAGAAFCRRTGPFGFIVLRNYCLMGGYESAAINKPLIYTGALKKGAARRMADTLDFWVNVTGQAAMKRFAPGFASTVKVRMIHAFSRIYIHKNPEWNNEALGSPINQGDMVATNLGFSIVFLEGIRRVGFRPTENEVKGLFHFWKYIGYLLGIPPEYLPDTEEQAIERLYKWTISQPMADEDTQTLAQALMNEPKLASFPKYTWQKRLLIKVHLGYNYYFLKNRACKTMGLPPTLFRYLPYGAAFINELKEYFVLSNPSSYNRAVNTGRKSQEKIRELFLRGHESLKVRPKHE
ncbi:MAG: oxygenase MpaB family protein [Bacteroidota bacterium]